MTRSILGIDTSTAACSVALAYGENLFVRHEILPQKHAHRVLQMVDEVMQEAGIEGNELDALAYGEGPGAFTGIRIAAGVIQGLSLGWNCPVIAVSSLEAMAYSALMNANPEELSDGEAVEWNALLDARMGEVYIQKGRYFPQSAGWQADSVQLLSPQDALNSLSASAFGVGDVEQCCPELTKSTGFWLSSLPHADGICRLAQMKMAEAKTVDQQIPAPLYLRNNVAETLEERRARQAL
ncbi:MULTISPECIES: tRNA (adenosine(37)-N6)-threonylcarbamoyltransferase complex dimerization subunit type 1 TsaB [Thiomicrorhabdus]|uniref:tRNA threonylcarbamoyladenosine biosynthesis protein TsaB n=1 Tax=Thiomicrorhabdus heinhorstiae TaxID=2748010 RepID=A0ABS0BSP8_9GAMM|nr:MULTISPECIES: tRNA (adenosine(37)-N6)-threonylcarbamoyltransferase complex dimerization subunit type 1 TsaB [Thiomicrorhabdus]MBF6056830.1 tRNA (adenosine(37)-N6)-threonylcarbamoyltransferase complex dimerization subunit type 1 TsaB [Thiomicrorhabdus heinhorstiae]